MAYRNLKECIDDLAATKRLVRVDFEVDANLEAAEIHRRVNQAGGPAVLFTRLKNCAFPMVSNLFGTIERARYIFRDSLDSVRQLVEMKIDPRPVLKKPSKWLGIARSGWTTQPKFVGGGPVLENQTTIDAIAATQVLAARWRGVHHAAAGLYRGSGPAGLAAFELGHVSRAAFGRTVSNRTPRSGCTIRFIAASACIMRRRCGAASRCGSTFSSAARRR